SNRPWPSTNPKRLNSASLGRPPIRSSIKQSSGSAKRKPRKRRRHGCPFTRLRVHRILIVRLTSAFARLRPLAQRLERLLDTQEVGGSSPPVPTSLRSRESGRRVSFGSASQAKADALKRRNPRRRTSDSSSMSQITVTLPDGSQRTLPSGSPVRQGAEGISPRLAEAALAAVVDGKLVDLTYPLQQDASVRIVTDKSSEALPLLRHSTAHLLAAAVTNLFPGVQCGIGPATDEGFFYDFVVPRPFVPEDLDAIERKMRELAAQDLVYERQMWPRDDAQAFFANRGEPVKVQLIDEKTQGQKEVSFYTIKEKETLNSLCVGPHVPSTGKLKAFKLLNTSNAYWKGDARNQPMQRVYGTAFLSEKDLKTHLTQLEEAKKRDHRKLGRELGLFTFHHWSPGAAFWQDKGTILYNTLANYMRDVLLPNGYVEVKTPLIYNKALWETSGHWSHYRQNMFQVQGSEGEEMAVKAMNCPGHYLLYASQAHSYRELPIRFHEQ